MTLNEIRALIAESDKTGRPIQSQNSAGFWRTMDDNVPVSLEAPRDCYRVAPPEPPKPREWWRETATGMTIPYDPRDRHDDPDWVRVREVMEGEK